MSDEAEAAPAAEPHPEPVSTAIAPEPDPVCDFTIYDANTGAIRITGHAPRSMLALQALAEHEAMILERLSAKTHYVDVAAAPPAARPRPVLGAFAKATIRADASDAASLVLPVALTMTVDGIEHPCQAGPLSFTADSAGTYVFAADLFPYLPFRAKVVAR